MPEFSKYSAYFDSLSDEKSHYLYEKQVVSDLIEDQQFNEFRDKNTFVGEVLLECIECTNVSEQTNGSEKVYVTKMRLDQVDDKIWDHPVDIKDPQERQKCIDSHQTAFITTDQPLSALPKPGDKVECYYADAGPNDNGKLRGLQFRSEIISPADSSVVAIYQEIATQAGQPGRSPNSTSAAGYFNGSEVPIEKFNLNTEIPEYNPESYTKPSEQFLRNVYESFGETYVRPIPGDIRLVATRFPVNSANSNSYRDVLNVFYNVDNNILVKTYQMTTSPGYWVLGGGETYGKGGTANLASPQLIKRMWKLDYHKKYRAGSQARGGSSAYFYRDFNNNWVPDNSPSQNVNLKFNNVGLNFHRSGESKVQKTISGKREGNQGKTYAVINGKWQQRITGIWTYGGGCQVLSDPAGFAEIIAAMEFNRVENKIEHYDYIIVDSTDYNTLLTKRVPELKQKQENYSRVLS